MEFLINILPDKWLETLPFIGLYAESHFRFRIPFSRYFKKEPELIFDTPWRLEPGLDPIIFLVIKDAHQYPIILDGVEIEVYHKGQMIGVRKWSLDENIQERQTHREFRLTDIEVPNGEIEIIPKLKYHVDGKVKNLVVDNYSLIEKLPLRITKGVHGLPGLKGWLSGDTHLHSSLTSDQIEFGASLEQTRACAQLVGMDFITATDHSYDLDDMPENYMENDPDLKKWTESRQAIAHMNQEHPIPIIPGEEISVANSRGSTVHFLHFNDPVYFPGNGDSGENWPQVRSQLSIDEILAKRSTNTVSVGAHTVYKFPWLQRLLLNRGWWEPQDHDNPELDGVQILCGTPASGSFHESRQHWIEALLRGKQLGVFGGSDGHGNFNRNWHVKLPVWSLGIHEDQIFAQSRTLLRSDSTQNSDLIAAMKNRRSALSTGPVGELLVTSANCVAGIGDTLTIKPGEKLKVSIRGMSTAEFGKHMDVSLFSGNLETQEESLYFHQTNHTDEFSIELDYEGSSNAYLRLEITSEGSRWPGVYISSPIWLNLE